MSEAAGILSCKLQYLRGRAYLRDINSRGFFLSLPVAIPGEIGMMFAVPSLLGMRRVGEVAMDELHYFRYTHRALKVVISLFVVDALGLL